MQFDPAGYKNEVNGIRNIPTVDEAVARFTTAYNTALRAEQLDQGGRVREATDVAEEFRRLFPQLWLTARLLPLQGNGIFFHSSDNWGLSLKKIGDDNAMAVLAFDVS